MREQMLDATIFKLLRIACRYLGSSIDLNGTLREGPDGITNYPRIISAVAGLVGSVGWRRGRRNVADIPG